MATAKTARNHQIGSGTVSTTVDSEVLIFSTSQGFLSGAAVVTQDGQQFTIRDGSGTAWVANQRASATVSAKTFNTSMTTSSRARGSAPLIVDALHYLYESVVDDAGAADVYLYFDTLAPNINGTHPYTGDGYTGKSVYQDAPPSDFGVPPRYRWWDDFPMRATLLNNNNSGWSWVEPLLATDKAGVLRLTCAWGGSWTPFGGPVYSGGTTIPLKSYKIAKRPILHCRFAQLTAGSVYAVPKKRIGFMSEPSWNTEPSDGVYFRFDNTTTATLKAVARKSNTETVLDTSIALVDGAQHMCQLVTRLGCGSIEVWVDAVFKGLLNTNIPTVDLLMLFNIDNGNFGGEGFDVDYYYVEADRP